MLKYDIRILKENFENFLKRETNNDNMLFEVNGYTNYSKLFEDYDSDRLSINEFDETLDKYLNMVSTQLLKEGIILDKVMDSILGVVANLFLGMVNLIKKGIAFIIKIISKIIGFIIKFKQKHPIIFKMCVIILLMMILVAMSADSAQAGQATMSPDMIDMLQGHLQTIIANTTDPDVLKALNELQSLLNDVESGKIAADSLANDSRLIALKQGLFKELSFMKDTGGETYSSNWINVLLKIGAKI